MGDRTISEIAFDLWASEQGLLDRLGLAAPERHEAGTQCWLYAGTALDVRKREVVHTFTRGAGTRQWSFSPWDGGRPDFEPVLEITIHMLRTKAKEAWRSASDALDAAVADGRVVIAGRIGSPVADSQSFPSSAWAFIDIDDWSAATGEGQGMGDIFDLREFEATEDVQFEDSDDLGRFASAVKVELAKIYPMGIPAHLTHKELHNDVCKHYTLAGINRQPSLDTVKRAAGRRKQK